ncbi:MAG: hypothetical protein SFW36_16585 [Leptolyngbyaceae cyanobacterium bins.59]|nr:hypothetical protein [Leptolyngbyaceae cyanobacterium bins.59]
MKQARPIQEPQTFYASPNIQLPDFSPQRPPYSRHPIHEKDAGFPSNYVDYDQDEREDAREEEWDAWEEQSEDEEPEHPKTSHPPAGYLLMGGTMLAAVGLLFSPGIEFNAKTTRDLCQEIVQPEAALTRQQLSKLLTVPERTPKNQVKAIIKDPYCKLPSLEVRKGAMAERVAYPLAFDSQAWFVVLYEGDEYAGYSFSIRR